MAVGGNYWNKYTITQIDQAIYNALNMMSGGASLIHQASVTLDNDDFANLEVSPVTMAGIPAVGRILVALSCGVRTNITTAYGNVANAATSKVFFTVNSALLSFETVFNDFNFDAFDTYARLNLNTLAQTDNPAVAPAPLLFSMYNALAGPLSLGDPANFVKPNAAFFVLDVATGLYLTTTESGWNAETRTFS